MTYEALQRYLDEVKWNDSVVSRRDMCGAYQRCRYCKRELEYPCAKAHNILVEVKNSPIPDVIPSWLVEEPDVKEVFGEEIATEYESAPPLVCEELSPAAEEKKEEEVCKAADGSFAGAARENKGYIDCRSLKRGTVCLFRIRKKQL